MKAKKIFVTGSRGFVGSYLLRQLKQEQFQIVGCDMYDCDITSFSDLVRDMSGDVVVHMAARVRAGRSLTVPHQYIQTNVLGTLNVLEVMRLKKIPRIIFFSSGGVKSYEEGAPYLWSKRMGELLVEMYSRLYGIEAVIVRPTNIYGVGNHKGIIYAFIKANKEGRVLQVHGSGSQTRDFIYVGDIVNAVMKSIKLDKIPNKCITVELGTGAETSVLELAKMVGGDNYTIIPKEEKETGVKKSVADITNAKKYLGWEAKVSLEEGLRRLMIEFGV